MKKWVVFIIIIAAALLKGLTAPKNTPAPKLISPSINTENYISVTNELIRREVVLMGSQFIFIVDAPHQQAINAIATVVKKIAQLETNIGSWKPGSDVYYINNNSGRPVKVSAETFAVIKSAKQLSLETNGAFDITIGAIWDLYPFREPDKPMPTTAQIQTALAMIGAKKILLNIDTLEVTIPKGMKINLGAIGKGKAAQIAMETFLSMGIKNAAISAGGDLYLLGKKQHKAWTVSIEDPSWEHRNITSFPASNIAIASSGNTKRYLVRNGKNYGHIVDPRTGLTVNHLQSVTVVTKNPVRADALATALFVMGNDKGLNWANAHTNIAALFIDTNGDIKKSDNWDATIAEPTS